VPIYDFFTMMRHDGTMSHVRALHEAPMPLFELDGDEADAVPLAPSGRLPSYIRDHRKRLRSRFMDGGAGAMPDYELLELVLFRAIPRQDVKPLARRLLDVFGDFNRVISAPSARLMEVEGVGDVVLQELKIVEAAAHRMARARVLNRAVLSSWDALLDYCHTSMAHRETEQFRVLYLDRKNTLIADEEQAQGTVDHVPVYPREVVKRALELNASALILVHNHPSGDPTPSSADISMTQQVKQAAHVLGLVLHDHLIIGKSCEVSFRASGHLE
jgi:DNA repair protein RadC